MAITLNGTTGITNDGGYTGDGVSFADTTPANTLVTDTGGNVGIGTASPTAISGFKTLEVKGTATNSGGIFRSTSGDGTKSVLFYTASAEAYMYTDQSIPLCFYNAGAERMRINSSGALLVGTTSFAVGTNGVSLQANGMMLSNSNSDWNQELSGSQTGRIRFFSSNGTSTQVGTITVNTTNTAYNTSSDYRLKENIAPMTGALAKVSALKPCTYTWKVDGSDGQGFIAHELAEVVPQAVTGEKDAVDEEGKIKPQGIDTSFLVATLTCAIQELKAELDSVKAELATLKA